MSRLNLNHTNVSFVKSALRVVAAVALVIEGTQYGLGWLVIAGIFIGLAEVLGVVEEIV